MIEGDIFKFICGMSLEVVQPKSKLLNVPVFFSRS